MVFTILVCLVEKGLNGAILGPNVFFPLASTCWLLREKKKYDDVFFKSIDADEFRESTSFAYGIG